MNEYGTTSVMRLGTKIKYLKKTSPSVSLRLVFFNSRFDE
jgi:hypothetical protein